MKKICQRILLPSFIVICTLTSTGASAAQYLCSFQTACLLSKPDQCEDVDELLMIRTPPDSWYWQVKDDVFAYPMAGDSDLFGTPGILSGQIVPAVFRRELPTKFLAASPRLNMAERVNSVTDQTNLRLSVSGPDLFTSPAEMLTTPQVSLEILENLKASFTVRGPLRASLSYAGTCEEWN